MTDRACPACHEPVLAHQTLCPRCRAAVPSAPGPVAPDSGGFTFAPPPPRAGPAVPSAPVAPVAPVAPGAAPAPAAPAPTAPPAPAAAAAPAPLPPTGHGTASAGTIGTPGAPVLDERGNVPGGVAALVAALLVTVGVFLPWITVEGRDVSGWAASGDAKVLLGLAVGATVVAALLIGGARSLVLRLTLAVAGLATLGLGAYDIASARAVDELEVSVGGGLFLVVAGGLVATAAAVLTRHRRFLPGPGPLHGAGGGVPR